jgi:hypothetical protein
VRVTLPEAPNVLAGMVMIALPELSAVADEV